MENPQGITQIEDNTKEKNEPTSNTQHQNLDEKAEALKQMVEQIKAIFEIIKNTIPEKKIPDEANNIIDALTIQLYKYDPEQKLPGLNYME